MYWSSPKSASGVRAITIMLSIVEKWSVVWPVTFYAARINLSCLDKVEWLSSIQNHYLKVYFIPLKQKTNLRGETVKSGLFLWLTLVLKLKYRTCKSFTLFH